MRKLFVLFPVVALYGNLSLAQEVVAPAPVVDPLVVVPESTDHMTTRLGAIYKKFDENRHSESIDTELEFVVEKGRSTFESDFEIEKSKVNMNRETSSYQEVSYDYAIIEDFFAMQAVYFGDQTTTVDQDTSNGAEKTFDYTVDSYGIGPEFTWIKNPKLLLMTYSGPAQHIQVLRRSNVNPVTPAANYSTQATESQTTLFTRTTLEAPKVFGSAVTYKLVVRYEPKFSDFSDHDIDVKHKFSVPLGHGFGVFYENASLFRSSPMQHQSSSRTSQEFKLEYKLSIGL